MGEKSTSNKDINCKNIDNDLCKDNKLFKDPLSYKLPKMYTHKTEYNIMQSREEEEVEPNLFQNLISKAWGDSPVCAI